MNAHEFGRLRKCFSVACSRHFTSISRTLERSQNRFWFTPNDGELDMPERNLTFKFAHALADSGYDILLEVGSLWSRRRFDLVAVDWKRGSTLLCEAKLLYSGKTHASCLESDIRDLAKVGPVQLKRKRLPSSHISKVVIASVWTRYHIDSMESLGQRLDKTREELVSRWANRPRSAVALSSHKEFNQLLDRLDRLDARFATEQEVVYRDRKSGEAEKQNILMAAW